MNEKPPILGYAGPTTSGAETAVFHRMRLIYGIGVGVCLLWQFFSWASWPHTSNSADPLKAELFMGMRVGGGAALVWLVLGLRRILLSRLARRNLLAWSLVAANAFGAFPILMTGYQ
jgi:hypothetical protein